jgi:alkanesulfonate monooxygenase SsuD/methylene tetrahydromethanopterin reductase-like flavin-dependent oxidoreductase (luciferase family)
LPGQEVVFGFGAHSGLDEVPELLRMAQQADRDGLDIFSLSDHPYLGGRVDAYAAVGFVLGGTRRLAGFANVTNLPLRPPPMLARTVTPSRRRLSWSKCCAAAARRSPTGDAITR